MKPPVVYAQTSTHAPRVSIGLPAYNGAQTLAQTIDSLLAQTLTDFELIISDNASTDDTVAIVEEYIQRDPRVRLIRQPVNLGANGNFSAVVEAARGKYFKWATCSDLVSSDFLQRCVDVLDTYPEVVLAAPQTYLFENNVELATPYDGDIEILHDIPFMRFYALNETLKLNNAMNGLIRINALRAKRPIIDHFIKADIVMIGFVALQGKFRIAPGAIFYRRMDPKTATILMSIEDDVRHHYPVFTAKALFPTWRLYWGWGRAVLKAPVSWYDRWRALRRVAHMADWSWRDFLGDFRPAAGYFLKLRWLPGGRKSI